MGMVGRGDSPGWRHEDGWGPDGCDSARVPLGVARTADDQVVRAGASLLLWVARSLCLSLRRAGGGGLLLLLLLLLCRRERLVAASPCELPDIDGRAIAAASGVGERVVLEQPEQLGPRVRERDDALMQPRQIEAWQADARTQLEDARPWRQRRRGRAPHQQSHHDGRIPYLMTHAGAIEARQSQLELLRLGLLRGTLEAKRQAGVGVGRPWPLAVRRRDHASQRRKLMDGMLGVHGGERVQSSSQKAVLDHSPHPWTLARREKQWRCLLRGHGRLLFRHAHSQTRSRLGSR